MLGGALCTYNKSLMHYYTRHLFSNHPHSFYLVTCWHPSPTLMMSWHVLRCLVASSYVVADAYAPVIIMSSGILLLIYSFGSGTLINMRRDVVDVDGSRAAADGD